MTISQVDEPEPTHINREQFPVIQDDVNPPDHDVDGCSRRKCKARSIGNLSQCLCGSSVSVAQIEAGIEVAQCKTAGCETKWVGGSLAYHII